VAVSAAKTLRLLLGGVSDASIRFNDLCSLLETLGFEKRVKGSHHLFRKAGVEERINLQRARKMSSRIRSNRCERLS
jgi:hypothetical protein